MTAQPLTAARDLSVAELEDLSHELRTKLLELCGTYEGAVHIGGDLSAADILTVLFEYGMSVDPDDIANPQRDRFVLSKGHAAVCMYIAMAIRGFFSYEGIVSTYGQLDSAYGMHPCKVQLPGVEASTGSLGHGLPPGGRHGAQRPPPPRAAPACSACWATARPVRARCGRPRWPPAATSSATWWRSSTETASS
ncbi:MAG: hypothetical protein PGN11_08350 [Quadrisphaera sp.]